MKNFNKILMAMLVATATLLTSCIDNKVAPEVTQLRAAQVAMANAKVSLQLLQNEAQRIANEYQEAINDLDVL
ncbi:MAG: hypothetical protein O2887_17770 [Bacteroidetes bacterium]|nr:hypothetical protein [Bacteroidota bacterium]